MNRRKQVRKNKCKVLEKPKACPTWENISSILGELLEGHKVPYTENLANYRKGTKYKIKTTYLVGNS